MNKSYSAAILMILIILLGISPLASAHVPIIVGKNTSLNSSTEIQNPTKSWVAYGVIQNPENTSYFSFNMHNGQEIYAMLLKSSSPSSGSFNPVLILIGPGISNSGLLPAGVQIPSGDGYLVVASQAMAHGPEYEPFGAESFYEVSTVILNAPDNGTYYLAVHSSSSGNYGLAIGQTEQYTIMEWITLPYFLLFVYMWLGESIWLILAPLIVTIVAGLTILYRTQRVTMRNDPFYYLTPWSSSLLFIGSGFSTLFQMFFNLTRTGLDPSALITVALAALPILSGLIILWLSNPKTKPGVLRNSMIGVVGVIGLFALGGYFIGPALAVISSVYRISRDRIGNK